MNSYKEIYADRSPLREDQKNKHLSFLKSELAKYLEKYSKAAHSKKFANKTNLVMNSFENNHDYDSGLTIVEDILTYKADDSSETENIHKVISRIVHDAIKETENSMNRKMADRINDILLGIKSEYRDEYYCDCCSKLAHFYKEIGDYDRAVELYTVLANIEERRPSGRTVPARYLLTYCYYKKHERAMSDYDLASVREVLDDYSDCGGDDYYSLQGSVESLENDIRNRRLAGSSPSDVQVSNQTSK